METYPITDLQTQAPSATMESSGATPLFDRGPEESPESSDPETAFDLERLVYSVIYSFDCHPDVPVAKYHPANRRLQRFGRPVWAITESWTNGPDEPYSNEPYTWKHRKLCAILTFEQFEQFAEDTGLYPEDCETGGSLGAPGFGMGWAPAVAFELDGDLTFDRATMRYGRDGFGSAYVTPIPARLVKGPEGYTDLEPTVPEDRLPLDESTWTMIRKALIRRFS